MYLKDISRRFIKNTIYNLELDNRLGYERNIRREKLYDYASEGEIKSTDALFQKSRREGESLPLARVSRAIPSLCGWVPRLNEQTKVLLYHFWSVNYGLRKEVLVRVSLVQGASVVSQDLFTLAPYSSMQLEIGSSEAESHETEGIVCVEYFHPRIPPNHGGHSGQLRFWGKYYDVNGEYTATVHSMPLAFEQPFARLGIHSRSYTDNKLAKSFYVASPHYLGDRYKKSFRQEENAETGYGYNLGIDESKSVRAIWHHAPRGQVVADQDKTKTLTQAFWVPPINDIRPVVVIDPHETGMYEGQTVAITYINGNKIIKAEKYDLSEVQSIQLDVQDYIVDHTGLTVLISFICHQANSGYAHIHYNVGEKYGDCVHAHACNPELGDGKAIASRGEKYASCLKFMHAPIVSDESHESWLVLTNIKDSNGQTRFKIRFILEDGKEFIENISMMSDDLLIPVNINSLLNHFSERQVGNVIVQLEDNNYNYDCSFLTYMKSNNSIATDHLTGG